MKNILNPSFLQKIDHHLLVRYPNLWISKIHYVIYYSLITTMIGTIIGLIYPFTLKNFPSVNVVYAYLFIPVVVLTILWIIKQMQYNLNHNYTESGPLEEFKRAIINLVVMTIIASQLYVLPVVLSQREKTFLNPETEKTIIDGLHYLNVSQRNYQYTYDFKTQKYTIYLTYSTNLSTDPLEKKRHPEVENYSKKLIKSKEEIFQEIDAFKEWYNKSYIEIDHISLSTEELMERFFEIGKRPNSYDINYDYYNTVILCSEFDHMIREINNSVENYHSVLFYAAIYALPIAILLLVMLISIFKQVFWQQFLITLGVGLLSPVVVAILAVTFFGLLDFSSDLGFFPPIILYFIFLGQSISSFSRKQYSGYLVVITILIHLATPFIPAYIYGTIREGLNVSMYEYNDDWWYQNKEDLFLIVGYVLALLSIPLFQPIYSRLYALPKKK